MNAVSDEMVKRLSELLQYYGFFLFNIQAEPEVGTDFLNLKIVLRVNTAAQKPRKTTGLRLLHKDEKTATDQCEAIEETLNKFTTMDKGFPLEMRVKGLIDRYQALSKRYESLKGTIREFSKGLED